MPGGCYKPSPVGIDRVALLKKTNKMAWKLWSKKITSPITEDDRNWLVESLLWYEQLLGKEFLIDQKNLTPTKGDFNRSFNGSERDARYVLRKLSSHMGIDINRLNLVIYSETTPVELSQGIYTERGDYTPCLGRYMEHSNGLIDIMVEESILLNPISLIATIAHELMHVKLLGDDVLDENDEYLTDLRVIVYGLGIFNANTSITQMNTWSNTTHSGWKISGGEGYLHYKVQAFALALLSNYRKDEDQEWLQYMNKEIRKIYKLSLRYIKENEESIKFK